MPLKKIMFRPGVNRENTRYAAETMGAGGSMAVQNATAGWYESDKIRFRAGTPEKIGGWQRISTSTFLGVCRSLWNWVTLGLVNLLGVGTNLKFYLEKGGAYYDITPIRATSTINNNPFALTASTTVTVTDTAHGCITGDFVTFSGATDIGGVGTNVIASILNREFQVTVLSANTYTIQIAVVPNATALAGSPGGGASVVAAYQINTGAAYALPSVGWGAGTWSTGPWGVGSSSISSIRLWSQSNWGEDLVFGPRGGAMYYWDATGTTSTRGVLLSSLGGTVTLTIASPCVITLTEALPTGTGIQLATTGALPTGLLTGTTYYLENVQGLTANLSATPGGAYINTSGTQSGVQSISVLEDVPKVQNLIFVADVNRFVFAMGCNDVGSAIQDPMLIRWCDQESILVWYPQPTNQAGSVRLSHGSRIVSAIQTRQEIVVLTDSTVYSLQYVGAPIVWSTQLLGDNISIIGQNAIAQASNVVYWMGVDKFYKYDGRVQTLRCDLRQYVFSDINLTQAAQVFAGTNEGFNEVWWFYCSNNSTVVDKYVVYNYLEDVWYYGTMGRTAWLDTGLRNYPVAATYSYNIVNHELGNDDNETSASLPIESYVASAEFDIDDGHNFGFVWRLLPDLTFRGSTTSNTPQVTISLIPMQNSGSGYYNPRSEGGSDQASVQRIATVPVEEFTGQVYIRVRGRQMVFKVRSDQLGTAWQLGAPRIDIRPDGRR
jgi:hypothetical protein